ncbi:MAG: LysM peptidoglycan-binding domain-containing protein [Gammaproteobacteria bacterium]|nr:LysM peptidoglycan-binding domain-containing protein [Gammaproteobacteria bacterium]
MKRLFLVLTVIGFAFGVSADVLKIKSDSPSRYVVVKGDTLWDISAQFLKSPWRWPEIWGYNKQINDPHWIYPGDVISLVYVNGVPRLVLANGSGKKQLKMVPHGRIIDQRQPIPTLSLADIGHYLTDNKIVSDRQIEDLPLIVGSERSTLFYKVGDIVYVNQELPVDGLYGFYNKGRRFSSVADDDFLGNEIELSGVARVTVSAAISRLELLSTARAVKNGQMVMALADTDSLPAYFTPRPAAIDVMSTVVASAQHFRDIGKNSVVIIEGGSNQGIKQGSVFSVYRPGTIQLIDGDNRVRGPLELRRYDHIKAYFVKQNQLKLPDVYRGKLMVFQTFEKVSYALVIELASPIRIGDELINPLAAR